MGWWWRTLGLLGACDRNYRKIGLGRITFNESIIVLLKNKTTSFLSIPNKRDEFLLQNGVYGKQTIWIKPTKTEPGRKSTPNSKLGPLANLLNLVILQLEVIHPSDHIGNHPRKRPNNLAVPVTQASAPVRLIPSQQRHTNLAFIHVLQFPLITVFSPYSQTFLSNASSAPCLF